MITKVKRYFLTMWLLGKYNPVAAYYGLLCFGYACYLVIRLVTKGEFLHQPVTVMTTAMLAAMLWMLAWIFWVCAKMQHRLDEMIARDQAVKIKKLEQDKVRQAEREAEEQRRTEAEVAEALESIRRDQS